MWNMKQLGFWHSISIMTYSLYMMFSNVNFDDCGTPYSTKIDHDIAPSDNPLDFLIHKT